MTNKVPSEWEDYTQVMLKKISGDLGEKAKLETFSFQELSSGEHWVSISSPELTCICPFSDYPDFGTVTIRYVPDKKCLELKSFKLYINAFRDIRIFHESITELIFYDFLRILEPKKAKITVDMNVRGNVKTICEKTFNC